MSVGAPKPPELRAGVVARAAAYAGEWLGYQQATLRVPGLTAAVRHQGDLVLSAAHGLADVGSGAVMTTSHAFRIASHSKTVAATLVAQLVAAGELRYDDTLASRLEWLGAPALSGITVRDLLSHASGLFRDGTDADFWQLDGEFPDADRLRAAFTDTARVLPGNAKFKYSNMGFALLGQLLEAVTGTAYVDLVRTRIAEPLGLRDFGGDVDDEPGVTLATGYTARRFGLERVALPHLRTAAYAAATGCYATAVDLSRFADALCLGSPGLLDDDTKRAMHQPLWDVDGEDQRYGLGLQVMQVGDRRVVGHGGAFPGFITATRIDPAARLVAVVLTNAIDAPAAELVCGVLRLIDAAHAPTVAGESVDADADRFTGRFFSLWGAADVVRLGDRLVAVDLDRIDPLDHVTVLRPVGDRDLEIVETSGMRYPGERLSYDVDPDGAVRAVRFGAQTWYPWERYRDRPYSGTTRGAQIGAGPR